MLERGLAAQVQIAFQDGSWSAHKMKPALGVLQYLSKFQGTYFSYRNDRLPCCDGMRPFYMWIVGDAARVTGTFNAVRTAPGLQSRHAALLGVSSRAPQPRVLTYSNRAGNWLRGRSGPLHVRQVRDTESPQFTVALNLGELPDDVVTQGFVMKNISVTGNFASVTPIGFYARHDFVNNLHPKDAAELDGATHFLVFKVTKLSVPTATVSVSVANALPSWCAEMTTDDDTNAAAPNVPPRTFGLLPIVSGTADALRGGDPMFAFNVTLER